MYTLVAKKENRKQNVRQIENAKYDYRKIYPNIDKYIYKKK